MGGLSLAGLGIGTGYLATVDVTGTGARREGDASADLTAWVNITPDNTVTIYVPFVEMGQGTHTGLAQLVCEELGLDISADNVRVTHPHEEMAVYTNWTMFLDERPEHMSGPMHWYAKRFMGSMKLSATGGSTAMVASWSQMRRAGAVARHMLQQAAMQKLGVRSDALVLQHAGFRLADGSAPLSFGDLAQAAASLEPPQDVDLKPPGAFQVIGKPVRRIDTADKITGKARFGIDVRLQDGLFATVRRPSVLGATISSVDDTKARSMRGVRDVIVHQDAVIVIADNTWRAFQAADALDIDDEPPGELLDTAQMIAGLRAGLDGQDLSQQYVSGDPKAAIASAARRLDVEYQTPYLAHATMEPMNCTVLWRQNGSVEAWVPTQSAAMARQAIQSLGANEDVRIKVTYAGGGFGRRAEKDFVTYAAVAARAHAGTPVQLVWSREEDMRHDVFRPASIARIAAGLDKSGALTAVDATLATHSVMASYLARNVDGPAGFGSDRTTLEGLRDMPYDVNNRRIAACEIETAIPIGFWRSVGHSNNAFIVESLMDECAAASGRDPFEFRLAHLGDRHARHKAVLETLRDKAGWRGNGGDGYGRGLALHASFRSIVGAVVDLRVGDDKRIVLEKVTAVIDCGWVVNPLLVEAQVQGGMNFGLTAACFGQIDFAEGRVVQDNFDSYEMLRLDAAPDIEVHLIDSADLPGGVGEPGTPVAAPALVNSLFAATGERVRRLPIATAGYSI